MTITITKTQLFIAASAAAAIMLCGGGYMLYEAQVRAERLEEEATKTIEELQAAAVQGQELAITAETLKRLRAKCWSDCESDDPEWRDWCVNNCVEVTLFGGH